MLRGVYFIQINKKTSILRKGSVGCRIGVQKARKQGTVQLQYPTKQHSYVLPNKAHWQNVVLTYGRLRSGHITHEKAYRTKNRFGNNVLLKYICYLISSSLSLFKDPNDNALLFSIFP